MNDLPFRLERTVTIRAKRETVFRYFTDSARWAAWWGEGSTIDARPGGALYIRHPGGTESRGEIVELDASRAHCLHVRIRQWKAHPGRCFSRHDQARS